MEITEEELEDALSRSGYLIENRVANWFTKNNFFVEPNITFFDSQSKKSREIDLFVDDFRSPHDSDLQLVVKTMLIIETINNPSPVLFFKGTEEVNYDLPDFIHYISDSPSEYDNFLSKIDYDFYHYFNNSPSTQYCSFQKKKHSRNKKDEWMAIHPTDLYETFKKLFFLSNTNVNQYNRINKYHRLFRYQPLLILNDFLLEAKLNGADFEINAKDNITFQFNFSSDGKQESKYIDVITESHLPAYINQIRNEDKKAFEQIRVLLKKSQ